MKKQAYWADLTREEFLELDQESTIAVLPIGAIEQHGPHLPVSVDRDLVEETLHRTFPYLKEGLSVLVLPTIAVGKSTEHDNHPGTITFSTDTFSRVCMDYARSVKRAGIRKLVIVNGHGGNTAPLRSLLRDIRIEYDLIITMCSWSSFGDGEAVVGREEYWTGIHGGDHETSGMLACSTRAPFVQMDKAKNFRTSSDVWSRDFKFIGLGGPATVAWTIDDLTPEGASGDASVATAEKGEQLMDDAARGMADFLEEFSRFEMQKLDEAEGKI